MAFARLAKDCEVYVYITDDGYVCKWCKFVCDWDDPNDSDKGLPDETVLPDKARMLSHLEQHVAAGHLVPERAFENVRDDVSAGNA